MREGSYCLAITTSPLKVLTEMVALPSPYVARMLWLLTELVRRWSPLPLVAELVRIESPPIVNGSSERIDPLKLLAVSSKPGGLASVSRTFPEWELIS
jgi:hypothetical protein